MSNESGGKNNDSGANASIDGRQGPRTNTDPAAGSNRWQEIDQLFTEALGLPEDQREAFLKNACGDDEELRRAAEELLAQDGELDSFLERPLGSDEIENILGDDTSVGPYRLLGQLGAGGMGTVYLAAQLEPVERKVALKLISPGLDSARVLARFAAERQALALMDHVNIATVYDAGCTESGRSYFAMEYVPGYTITEHCDREGLRIRDRVRLFLQVCDGVQHAHQKGLIHRDLKPGNILVRKAMGEKPTVKIIDFGVAKSLQRQLTDSGAHTQLGTFVGTPVYSSPEQIMGRFSQTDTRSDIYSIGVVLYEMLVGLAPHDSNEFEGKTQEEIANLLTRQPLPSPLERFQSAMDNAAEIARQRSQSVDALQQRLSGDISWILQKCLEGNPDDRYPSVSDLRKDLERWLNGLPLEARPTTRLYRLQKLVRRNKRAFTAATLVSLAILTTTTVAIIGFFRAEEAAARARQAALEAELAADFQVEQLAGIDPAAMGMRLRANLLATVEKGVLDSRQASMVTDAEINKLHDFLRYANFTDLSLSMLDDHVFERAEDAIEAKYGDTPLLQARLRQSLAEILSKVGLNESAAANQEHALELRRQHLGPHHISTLESLQSRGRIRLAMGQPQEAEEDLRKASEQIQRQLGDSAPETLRAWRDLGQALFDSGEYEEAERYFTQVLDGRRRILGDDHPDTLESIGDLALSFTARRDAAQAELLYLEALEGARKTLGEEHPITLEVLNNLGMNTSQRGNFEQAEALFREVLEIHRRSLGNDHPDTLASVNNVGFILLQQGQHNEAKSLYRGALETSTKALGSEHPTTLALMQNFAGLSLETGDLERAESLLREVLDAEVRLFGAGNPNTLGSVYGLGLVLHEREKYEEAEPVLRQALSGFKELLGSENPRTQTLVMLLARALNKLSRYPETVNVVRENAHFSADAQKQTPWQSAVAWSLAGEALAKTGNYKEAESALLESYDVLDSSLPDTERAEELPAAVRRLVELYTGWNKPNDAARWQSKLVELDSASSTEG